MSMGLLSCQFSISEDKVKKEFKSKSVVPQISSLKVRERTMNYAFLNQGKDALAVFIHGSPGSWNAFIDFFKNDSLMSEVDMISIDRPGFGLSDPGIPEPSLQKQAMLVHEVVQQFNHERILLIGHSLGGPVIARMAMDYPDAYQGLIFVAPSIDPEMEKNEWYRSWIKTKVGGWVTPKGFWVSNEEIITLKEELTEMIPLWKYIQTPSIVIQGKKDMLVPWENAEFARKMLQDHAPLDVRYLEKVNHFIPWSHPETIVQAIFDFL